MVEWRLFFLETDEGPIRVFDDAQMEKAFAAFSEASKKNLNPSLICKNYKTGKLQIVFPKKVIPAKEKPKEKQAEEMVPA